MHKSPPILNQVLLNELKLWPPMFITMCTKKQKVDIFVVLHIITLAHAKIKNHQIFYVNPCLINKKNLLILN